MKCKLEYHGKKPATIFLHGFLQSFEFWRPAFEELTRAGQTGLVPDLPGFGASADEAGPHTMAGLADSVARFLDENNLQSCSVVGGSMGGVVAQHLALRHPGRVSKLVLVATGGVFDNPAKARGMAEQLANGPWDEAAVSPFVQGFFHHRPKGEAWTKFINIALSASRVAAVEAGTSNADNNTLEQLSQIRVPTLIIQGRHDKGRTPEHGEVMRQKINGSKLAVLEDSGHTPQLDQADEFNAIAIPFLLQDS